MVPTKESTAPRRRTLQTLGASGLLAFAGCIASSQPLGSGDTDRSRQGSASNDGDGADVCQLSADPDRTTAHFDVVFGRIVSDGEGRRFEAEFERRSDVVDTVVLYDHTGDEFASGTVADGGATKLIGPIDDLPTESVTYTAVAYNADEELERLELELSC